MNIWSALYSVVISLIVGININTKDYDIAVFMFCILLVNIADDICRAINGSEK